MQKALNIFLFLLISHLVFSQSLVISSTIYDQQEIAIPYVNIYVKGERKGTVSNKSGHFALTINREDIDKSLIISAIGFESQTLSVSTNLPSKIYLKEIVYDLTEAVVLSGKERIIESGNLEFPVSGDITNYQSIGMRIPTGYQSAIFLENPTPSEGLFKNISFFIAKEGKYKTPFRVKVYSIDEKEDKPDSLLVKKDIIITAKKKGEWCQIDVSRHHIPFPKNGAFVVMEWLHNEKKYQYTRKGKYSGKKWKLQSYGQGLGLYSKAPNYESWSYYLGVGWKKEIPTYKPLIKAQIAIYE